jgi:hypothetical protein
LYILAASPAAALHGIRRVWARQGWAGEKSGHFEHPVSRSYDMTIHKMAVSFGQKLSFSAAC